MLYETVRLNTYNWPVGKMYNYTFSIDYVKNNASVTETLVSSNSSEDIFYDFVVPFYYTVP